MKNYRVSWDIEIEAATPKKAAIEARRIRLDPDSTAILFGVWDEKKVTNVDLQGVKIIQKKRGTK